MSRDRRWLAQSSTLTSLFFENALKSIKSRGENPKKVEKAANAIDLGVSFLPTQIVASVWLGNIVLMASTFSI
jgi:hypothetical protein